MQSRLEKRVLLISSLAFGFFLGACDGDRSSLDRYRPVLEARDYERQKNVTVEAPATTLLPPGNVGAGSVAWCGDSRKLLSSSSVLLVWDVDTRAVLHTLERISASSAIACSRDGRLVASGNYDKPSDVALRMWDLKNPSSFRDVAGPFPSFEGRNDSVLAHVVFSPDSKTLIAHYVNSKRTASRLVIYDARSGKAIREFTFPGKLQGKPILNGRGTRYAFARSPLRIVVIDTANGRELSEIALERVLPSALAFGRADDTIWIGGRRLQDTVDGRTKDGRAPFVLQQYGLVDLKLMKDIDTGHTDGLCDVIFDEHADLVITASGDKTMEVRQGHSGRLMAVYGDKKNPIEGMALRPDGQFLATASRKTVELWALKVPSVQRD
jgi:WD40 repeat protein